MHAISWDMLVNLQYSEQSQEHWNKYMTRFKSGAGACARQHGVSVNLVDIYIAVCRICTLVSVGTSCFPYLCLMSHFLVNK